jgi:hypothetical protein
MALPQFQDGPNAFQLMQNAWASQLNNVLSFPISNGSILQDVPLLSGANVINHKLGRKLQGWAVVRMVGAFAQVYETTSNTKTLTLNASAPTTISLLVF